MHYHGIHKASSTTIRSIGLDYCVMPNGSTVGFKSWAKAADCVEVATNVRMRSTAVVHRNSLIPQTFGMEGAVTGSRSGKPIHGPATPAADAKTVKTERGELVRHDQLWDLNAANCKGIACHDDAVFLDIDVDRSWVPELLGDGTRGDEAARAKYMEENSIPDLAEVDMTESGDVVTGADGKGTLLSGKSDIHLNIHGADLLAVGPEKLASFLKANGFSGGRITLLACNGADPAKAGALKKELTALGIDSEILAFDAYVNISNTGKITCIKDPLMVMPGGKGFLQLPESLDWMGTPTTFPDPSAVQKTY